MKHLPVKLIQIFGAFLITIALPTTSLKAQPVKPNSAESYLEQGINLSEQNEFVNAIEAYTQAIKLNPNNALAYYNRGLAFYHLRNHSAALEDFNQTIQLKPDIAVAYKNRGLIFMYLLVDNLEPQPDDLLIPSKHLPARNMRSQN